MCRDIAPVTYWGLRDYGLEPLVWGALGGCKHEWANERLEVPCGKGGNWQQAENGPGLVSGIPQTRFRGDTKAAKKVETRIINRAFCLRCSAWRGSLGLEPTPDLYVQHLVEIFREVWRVLQKDGTVWLNLGDSYASPPAGNKTPSGFSQIGPKRDGKLAEFNTQSKQFPGLKHKDLVGIPWKVAFALQAVGWYLRSDIIWAKPNPMPESIKDRPTRSHEYMFLLSKSERYYYNAQVISEPSVSPAGSRAGYSGYSKRAAAMGRHPSGNEKPGMVAVNKETRNRRSVWFLPTQPYKGAHFATFPEKLVEPCILAGAPVGGIVLDPFVGSGTVVKVAQRLGRVGVGIDLKPEYLQLAQQRLV